MNWNLIRKTISDRWRGTAVYAGGLLAYVLMLTALFPSVQKVGAFKKAYMKDLPEGLIKFFNLQKFDVTSFDSYMTIQFLGLLWVIVLAAFAISFARNMVAGEIQDGTLELLLAQPIARWKVMTSEGAVLLGGIIGLVATTVVSTFAFGAAFGVKLSYAGYLAFLPLGIALAAAIAGYSVLLSAVMKEPRRVAMAAAGLTLFFYLIHFGGMYSRVLEKFDWFGIFHYYNPQKVLSSGGVPARDVLVLLAFAAVFFAAALLSFQRRDIAV